jgi:hypothetical protein
MQYLAGCDRDAPADADGKGTIDLANPVLAKVALWVASRINPASIIQILAYL